MAGWGLGRHQAAAVSILGMIQAAQQCSVEGGGGESGLLYTALLPVFTRGFSAETAASALLDPGPHLPPTTSNSGS